MTRLNVYALAIDPKDTQTIYAGTGYGIAGNYGSGVFRSTNGGGSWSTINTGLTNFNIYHLAVDPFNPNNIYACTLEGGIFKSTNKGTNWSPINSGLTELFAYSLVVDPTNNNILYAGVSNKVYQSINGGNNWTDISSGLPFKSVLCLTLDPTNPKTVYAGLSAGGVYKWSINSPPVFRNLPASKSISSGMPFTYQVEAFDQDGDTLTYSVEGAPPGMNINSTGLISWLGSQPGSYTITVRITDGINSPITSTLFLKVTTTLVFTIDKKEYLINNLPQTMDVAPVIKESRTLLPIRFVAEPLGASVFWDGIARKVTMILGPTTIVLWIDKPVAQVNGRYVSIDPDNPKVVPIIINSRTLLPLRFLAESLGAEVSWNGVNRTVTIIYPR